MTLAPDTEHPVTVEQREEPPPGVDLRDPASRRRAIATALGLTAGGLGYLLTLLNYGTDLTRTALGGALFSNFFDDQGRALLDGRLDLPPESLGIEGFVHDGRTYTYFPPFPALLRLPVLMTTREYDYRLTALSMLLAWIVLAVMASKLIWLLIDQLVDGDLSRRTATLGGIFIAGATGGTFLTYDAGLPWVYHEVYTWAVTAAVGALYWMVRTCLLPSTHAVWWLFVFGLVAVGSRATEGWAVALGAIGLGLLMRWRPFSAEHRALWWRIVLAGVAPLAASITLNMYKFDAIYMFPLKDQVWTQVNEQRQAALAANGGTLSGPQFFTTSFMAYLRPDGIRFTDHFPWITLPAEPAQAYHGAVVDQAYRTGSVTGFMTLFLLLFLVAAIAAFRPRTHPLLARLRVPLLSSVLATGGVMSYGYYSTRYASDFVPALVLGGAIGTVLVARRIQHSRRWAVPAISVLALGTAFAIVAQMAIGMFMAAVLHRGEPLQRYLAWQGRVSPGAQAELVHQFDGLPTGGKADDIGIRGSCDALYLHTGDQYEPWVPVEEKDQVWVFRGTALNPGRVDVLEITGTPDWTVSLEVARDRRVRAVLRQPEQTIRGKWFQVPTDGVFRLGLRNLLDLGYYRIETTPGGAFAFANSVYFDEDWNSLPAAVSDVADDGQLARLGLTMQAEPGLALPLCQEIAARAGIEVSDP